MPIPIGIRIGEHAPPKGSIMATESTPAKTPPYIPWRTFTNTLDALARNVPNRIDKTAFPGQSGAGQTQLLIAFRFLGLITDDGKPTPTLHALAVQDEAARKTALRKVMEDKYATLFALNLLKTTPAEFAERMTEVYAVNGDTRLKATRFFLAAADYLDIQVSPLLLRDKTKPTGGGTTKSVVRKRRARRNDVPDDDDDIDDDVDSAAGESRTVTLRSGGTLTLSASTKFMALSSSDRTFVFGLIDKLEEYEKENPAE
jgi:hypothetical protein